MSLKRFLFLFLYRLRIWCLLPVCIFRQISSLLTLEIELTFIHILCIMFKKKQKSPTSFKLNDASYIFLNIDVIMDGKCQWLPLIIYSLYTDSVTAALCWFNTETCNGVSSTGSLWYYWSIATNQGLMFISKCYRFAAIEGYAELG